MRLFTRSLVALALFTAPAFAGEGEHAVIYAGAYDISQQDDQATLGGLEYRFKDQFNGLRPAVGIMGTTDNAAYAYAGAYWDLPLNTEPLIITPGFAAGAYHHGDGKDLGSGIEFRSTIEVAYQMEAGNRIGLGFSHISNASIGNDNPGAETLQVVYSHPMW